MRLNILPDHPQDLLTDKQLGMICRLVDDEIGLLEGQVNLVFCGEDHIKELNKEYRAKNKVTDVLTFPYFDEDDTQAEDLLGEIFVCIPQLKRQSTADDWTEETLERFSPDQLEMIKLCVHGLYHLRGYDHIEDADYRVMKLLEDKTLERFFKSEKI